MPRQLFLPPAPNTLLCYTAQERQAAKKAAKRERARLVKRRLAKAKREAEGEQKRMIKAKKKKQSALRV